MARRRSQMEVARVEIGPTSREFKRVWGGTASDSAHPFGRGRPFPDFESWCAGRAALGDTLEKFELTTEDFEEK